MKETGEQVSYFQNVNVSFVLNSVETIMYSLTVLSIRLKTLPIQINVRVVTGRGVTQSTHRPDPLTLTPRTRPSSSQTTISEHY